MARKIKRKMAAGGNLTGNLSNQGYQNENFTKNRTYVGNKALQYLYGSWAGAADILGMGSLADSALEDQGIEMGDVYNASRGIHGATGGAVAGFFGVGEGTGAGQKGLGDLGQGNEMNGQNLGAYNTYSQNNINIPKSNTTQINNEGPFVTPELYPEKNSKQLFMFGGLRRFTGKGGGDFNDLPEPPAIRAGAEGTPVSYPNNPGFTNVKKPNPDFSKFGNAPISLSQNTNFAIKKYDPVGDSTKIYDSRLTSYNNVPRLNNGVLTAPGAGINNITLMGTGTNPNVLRSTVAKEQPGGFAMGGNLTELNAPTHEEGGFTMGGHELEGTETIDTNNQYVFSDRLKVPGKKYNFSKASKIIKNKYKLRENDKMSDEAMQQELDDLMNTQEVLKQGMMEKAYMKAYGGNMYANGGPYTTPELYPTDAMGLFDPNTGQITRIPDQGIDFTTFNRPQEPLLDFTPSQGGYVPSTSQIVPELNQTWAPDRGGVNFINNTNKPVMIPRNTNNNIPNITNTFAPVGTPNDINESDNVNRDYNNKLSPYGYIASALTTTGKVLANQLQSKPTQLPNIYLERLSKDPAIQARIAAQNRLAVMNKALGQQADTSGQAVANIGMFNTEAANNLAQTIGQQEAGINAANVQLSNQEKQINLGQFEKNALMNEQFKDNRLNNTMTNMDSYNHLAQTMNTDSIKNRQQNQMINNWIKTKDYSILPNGKPAYMTSDEKGNIIYVDAEGVRYNIKGQVLKLNS